MSELTLGEFSELYLSYARRELPGFDANFDVFTSAEVIERLFDVTVMLLTNAKKFNLTSIVEPREIIRKHIIDSLIPLGLLLRESAPKSILDVGTGAGFPLLPMACAMSVMAPDARLVGLDATAKKISHINETAKFASLANVSAINGRAEEVARGDCRAKFDLVVARAVAPLPILLELCSPLVAHGGKFAALKSHADEEISASAAAAKLLGLENSAKIDYEIPGGDMRCLIIYSKTRPTPQKYPRRYAEIAKQPLK